MKRKAHFGDPCVYCDQGLDQVEPGDCPGRPGLDEGADDSRTIYLLEQMVKKPQYLQGAPHTEPEQCPTWYVDKCQCTVQTLRNEIEFAESRHQQYHALWQRYTALKMRQLRVEEAALALLVAIYQGAFDAPEEHTDWLDDVCSAEMLALSDALKPEGAIDEDDPKAWDYGPQDRG